MAAQSPHAHTPSVPGTAMLSSTTIRPLSFCRGNDSISGDGATPAVQINVRAPSAEEDCEFSEASSERIRPSKPATLVRSRTSIPAARSFDSVYAPSAGSNSGSSRPRGSTRTSDGNAADARG